MPESQESPTDRKAEIREAVKRLRTAIKNPDGTPLTQVQFAPILGVGLSTLQRYEQLVPPKGKTLYVLADIARQHGHSDLELFFKTVGNKELSANPQDFVVHVTDSDEAAMCILFLEMIRNPKWESIAKKVGKLMNPIGEDFAARAHEHMEVHAVDLIEKKPQKGK
jgi:hypothetical protein